MIIRIAALLLLCTASLPLLAGESHAADGDCPPTMDVDEGNGAPAAGPQGPDGDPASRDPAPQPRQGGGESGGRGPRMHNLLPGMFR